MSLFKQHTYGGPCGFFFSEESDYWNHFRTNEMVTENPVVIEYMVISYLNWDVIRVSTVTTLTAFSYTS